VAPLHGTGRCAHRQPMRQTTTDDAHGKGVQQVPQRPVGGIVPRVRARGVSSPQETSRAVEVATLRRRHGTPPTPVST
jgi:hypothetical protein